MLKLKTGDTIALTHAEFVRLGDAFFAEIVYGTSRLVGYTEVLSRKGVLESQSGSEQIVGGSALVQIRYREVGKAPANPKRKWRNGVCRD